MATGKVSPIGTIRIQRTKGAKPRRLIKVSNEGSTGARWITYARWWWTKHMGPVPAGKRVIHVDGDTLNEEPSNYAVVSAADVAFLAHERDPKMSERNFARMRIGAARHNHFRAVTDRLLRFYPNAWYAVDFENKVIRMDPSRQEWISYARAGLVVDDPRTVRAASLGFATLTLGQACILHVLMAHPEAMTSDQVAGAAQALRASRDWRLSSDPAIRSELSQLLNASAVLVGSRGRRGHRTLYAANPGAFVLRKPVFPLVALRGRYLAANGFGDFQRQECGFRRVRDRNFMSAMPAEAV